MQELINRCEQQQTTPRQADVQNAIATADHAARLGGLPTYSQLASALRNMTGLAVATNDVERMKIYSAVSLTSRIPHQ